MIRTALLFPSMIASVVDLECMLMMDRLSRKTEEQAVSEILSSHRLVLNLTGSWPENENTRKSKICEVKGDLIFFSAVMIVFIQSILSFVQFSDITTFFENLSDAGGLTIITLRLFFFKTNRRSMRELTKEAGRLSMIHKTPEAFRIMKVWHSRRAKLVKYLLRAYAVLTFFYCLGPALLDSDRLPWNAKLPSYFYGAQWFYAIYILQALIGSFALMELFMSDIFITFVLSHLCGELESIAVKIKKIGRHRRTSIINDIIEKHVIAVAYGDKVCQNISTSFYMETIISMIVTCFYGFTVLLGIHPVTTAKALVCSCTMIFKVFIKCLIGEKVSEVSLGIGKAVMESNWHLRSVNDQRAIQLILLRAQKPLQLRVGTLGVMNLRQFSTFIFNVYSCLTVLNTVIKR